MMNVEFKNGEFNVTADGEIFIIPNHAARDISVYCLQNYAKKSIMSMCDSEEEFDRVSNDWLIQTWMTSDDLDSDNLSRHYGDFKFGDKRYLFDNLAEDIPISYLPQKEGEAKTIKFKTKCSYRWEDLDEDDDEHMDAIPVNITLNLTAAQTKYRYRNFGTFEEVLQKVCC